MTPALVACSRNSTVRPWASTIVAVGVPPVGGLGVRVPSGAQVIKVVTCNNRGHGLFLSHFVAVGPVCWNVGASLVLVCFGGGLCWAASKLSVSVRCVYRAKTSFGRDLAL